jgi:hypothetical protein
MMGVAMMRTIVVVICLLVAGCAQSTETAELGAREPGLIRDAEAAIGIAMHAYLSMRGQKADAEALEAWQTGYEARLARGIWEITDSTLPSDPRWRIVFHVSASDGRITGIYHRSPDGRALLPLPIASGP